MLRWFGIPVETSAGEREDSRTSAVDGPVHFTAREVSVPGDISSAGYFIAAAALLPDSSIEITNVGVNPTRTLYLEQLRAWGFDIEIGNTRDKSNEPVGTVRAHLIRGAPEGERLGPLVASSFPGRFDVCLHLGRVGYRRRWSLLLLRGQSDTGGREHK